MTELLGYVFEPLWEDGEFILSRGVREGDLFPLLVMSLALAQPAPGSLQRLEHAYALREELDAAWAVRPLDLVRHHGRTMLVLEDPGGEPLNRLLGSPMEVTLFLRVAIGLSVALAQLHARGLIHKDVKPGNILVNAATGEVWLTGFGIASRLPREHQTPAPPEVIAGTLAYMAPEQTGRMNRSIDSRSDLYALGVTLYQMFTGTLPFTAADPMEWIHCHIARRPVPPTEGAPGLSVPIAAIVMKLLAKTAEERYQTAAGVAADLRRCLAEWEARGRIDAFPLGMQDVSDRLLIPEKLYGRERESEALLAAFERVVADGTPEFVLVSGYSGIGKSAVVHELHKALVPPRGLFASGKFDQYKRDIPYATLAQAFRSLLLPILSQREADLIEWRDALRQALGANGQLIVNLIPELELVIGKQPPVADLPPQNAQHHFQLVFRRFISVFTGSEHSLVLFLDDLQWLDAETLDLLEHLVTEPEVQNLLLIGAYRDNEVSPAHPLMHTLEAVRKAEARVHEIVLTPLGLDDVGRLLAAALHCEPERARPLAQLVHEKTGGNPFFAIQFLTALAEEGLLAFDPVAPAWQWDIDRIRAKSYTDNVVELLAGKLKRLSTTTQEALKQLACVGNVVEIATLTLVHGETQEAIDAALLEAVHAGLVFQHDNAYTFLHDRIQQAAYSLIPDERRADAHLRIGRVLLASMTADQLAEHLFDVANQLNRGAGRLIDRDEKAQVATIDLRAGRKAKASAAYASARAYFSAGMALLDERDWSSQYELTFSLWLERAECEFLTSHFEKAEQLIGELLQRGTSNVAFADASCLKVQLHVVKGEYPQSVDSALTCLRLFGIDLPAHPTWEQVQAEYETVWQTLDGRPIESLIDLPLMTDPELQAAMEVLSVLTSPAYFTDSHLACLFACRMVSISMQRGMSGASAHGYILLGYILGPVFHRYGEGYRFAKLACDLVEKHGFITYQARVHYAMALVALWTQPIGTAIDLMRAAFRTAIETGDLTFACYAMYQTVTDLLLRNDPLDAVWRESEMALDFAREAKYGGVAQVVVSQQRFIATMQGRTATFSTFSDAQFDEATFEAQLTGDRMISMICCFYWLRKLEARFLSGDYAEALAAAAEAKALLSAAAGQIQLLDYFYYTALTVAALYEKASDEEQNRWRELLTAHREQLREWAETYPPTFADKHALVSAESARLEGRDADAMRLYEQAIQSAREHGFVQNEGLAHEVAARFYAVRGFETFAHAYRRNARDCYRRWGAEGKVRQLEQSHPQLREESAPLRPTTTIGAPIEHLDLATVIKMSQAVSGEIVLEKLIDTLMTIAVEHAGAERGFLLLPRDDALRIEAEATTGRDRIEVRLRHAVVTPAELPETVLHYVLRTQESVLLDDAAAPNPFSADAYIGQTHARSVLCLPLVKQSQLIGVLYLENTLAPNVFTPTRLAVLKLLASQAAIALENALLYAEIREAEEKVRRAERDLRRVVDMVPALTWTTVPDGANDFCNQGWLNYTGLSAADTQGSGWMAAFHPEDLAAHQDKWSRAVVTGEVFEHEARLRRADGAYHWFLHRAVPLRDETGHISKWYGTSTDIDDHKQVEQARTEQVRQAAMRAEVSTAFSKPADLREILRGCTVALARHVGVAFARIWTLTDDGNTLELQASAGLYTHLDGPHSRIPVGQQKIGQIAAERQPHLTNDVPNDARVTDQVWARNEGMVAFAGYPLLVEERVVGVMAMFARARLSAATLDMLAAVADLIAQGIERKHAEETVRQQERELRQLIDFVPQSIFALEPNGSVLYANQVALEYCGLSAEDFRAPDIIARVVHPDDLERFLDQRQRGWESRTFQGTEVRVLHKDGQYRWFLIRYNPLRDEQGHIVRWYVTGTDIEDRKQAEERFRNENVALREALDTAFMFEEIVGTSPALHAVLVRVAKVAPTDSTVLITGETGTGKELIARAIHKRSLRAARAFVSVNCAAIPPSLLASELFGHEKGAFTGAVQRRLGRFELADGGTLFLDEIGELPAETQLALLRVLQEREFERVGGSRAITVDVRVIAATNRDLPEAIAAGTFRSDLFYRINVFPIEMPPLRARQDDIPLLLEYFIHRYARKAGKKIRGINTKTLELLQAYRWPGNIRELQNVIERSVIVCETETFSVDASWLAGESRQTQPASSPLAETLVVQEKALIEAALAECRGRVSGPSGAAAKLGMPPSTLESKIRSLQINKHHFKPV